MRASDAPGWSSALSATEAAKALRDGAYLPSEHVRDVLASAVSRNPERRAFVEIYAGQALRDAGVSDRRLARGAGRSLEGVAFAVKDVIDVKGHRTRGASQSTAADPVASADAEVVTPLGARILDSRPYPQFFQRQLSHQGRTVVSELALVTVTTLRPPGPAFDADSSDDTSSTLSPRVPFNVVGAPAITVPISLTANGLSLSMKLVGARGADYQLLAIAHAREQALDGRVQPLTARRS
jgi:Asp-tRNA(Asn)/Glu-tRNA(Gln) amidotransferase A subunit family amidase